MNQIKTTNLVLPRKKSTIMSYSELLLCLNYACHIEDK